MNKLKMVIGIALVMAFGVGNQTSQASELQTEEIAAQLETLSNGAQVYIYEYSDGSTMRVPSHITKTVLLASDPTELEQMGVPPKPSTTQELSEWISDYSVIESQEPDALDTESTDSKLANTIFSENWGGYLAGSPNVTNSNYVGVKGNFVVPDVADTCNATRDFLVGAWVGLGGTNNTQDDLVQQGIGWCNPLIVNSITPWMEFAPTQAPHTFCGFSKWSFNAGDVIYNNMTYQNSTDTAYFYMQNQSTGVSHSCSRTAPLGWVYNGNTGECIVEKLRYTPLADYGTIRFTNCQVELGVDSTWYPIGDRSSIKQILNYNPANGLLYQSTGNLGADNKSFTMTFLRH